MSDGNANKARSPRRAKKSIAPPKRAIADSDPWHARHIDGHFSKALRSKGDRTARIKETRVRREAAHVFCNRKSDRVIERQTSTHHTGCNALKNLVGRLRKLPDPGTQTDFGTKRIQKRAGIDRNTTSISDLLLKVSAPASALNIETPNNEISRFGMATPSEIELAQGITALSVWPFIQPARSFDLDRERTSRREFRWENRRPK